MFRYQPGIRHAQYLILQQPCLHYGISTPTLQIGSHSRPTSLIRRQWLSKFPPKSLGTMQEERGQPDVYPSDQKLTKAHSTRKLGSRSIKLDTGSGGQELFQELGRFKGDSKERRKERRELKVVALVEARQVLRKLREEQKKKRQLSDQSDSAQLSTGLNDSELPPKPESLAPKNDQIDLSNVDGIKVQKINRALLKAPRKLKSYPEWVEAQKKPNQPPLVRRIENFLPLVHKVVTGNSFPVSDSQDSTATTTAEQKHPPLVRKIVHESGIRHIIPGSISPIPEESHKNSSFTGSENQEGDLENRQHPPLPSEGLPIRDKVRGPHIGDHKVDRARLTRSGEISFTKGKLGPVISGESGEKLERWQLKLLKKEQRKANQALMELPDGGRIRKYRTADKTEGELRKLEERMETRRRREKRRKSQAESGMTKKERKMDRKARKKERSKLLKIQRTEKAAKKGMAYKEFIAKTKEQEVEKKKRKDELKEKLKLEELTRLETMEMLEEVAALEVERRMELELREGEGGLGSRIKMQASLWKRNALKAKLKKKITARVRRHMSCKTEAMKLERDPDLEQQVKEVFSPSKQASLPRTIKLMVIQELKAKVQEEWELEIQRDPVLAKLLSSRDEPIRPGVKYAAERSRRKLKFMSRGKRGKILRNSRGMHRRVP